MSEHLALLYRPVGPKELELIAASGYREFPPRLPEQPIFYPVLSEEYARQIARDWNVEASGAGYVTRFALKREFAAKYPIQKVGSSIHQELWIPAEDVSVGRLCSARSISARINCSTFTRTCPPRCLRSSCR